MSSKMASQGIDIATKAVRYNSGDLVVYSAVIGGYDDPPAVSYPQPQGVQLVCISDRLIEDPGPWEIVRVDSEPISARAQAKVYKLFPHVLFPNMKISIWLDGTFEIIGDMSELADMALKGGGEMAVFLHPTRACAYAEARACRRLKKENMERLDRQMARYKAKGFAENMGLLHGGVLIRRHGHRSVIETMESWWYEVSEFSMRDQLSFNFVAWRQGLGVESLDQPIDDNVYLKWRSHKRPAKPEKRGISYEFWCLFYRLDKLLKRASRKYRWNR